MAITDQLKKLKANWLLIALALVLFMFISSGGGLLSGVANIASSQKMWAEDSVAGGYYAESAAYAPRSYYPSYDEDFAPDVTERKVVKTTSMSTEVERGDFSSAESKLKSIITSSDSFLLDENVNRYGVGRKSYQSGSYQIKVDNDKYESVITQLKDIGEVQSFRESSDDVTGRYTNIQIEISTEKERLKRYQDMYEEATQVSDKIELNDRIFNQERRVKYLEDQLKNIDTKVDYSTIYLTLSEKRSDYANVVWVKFSELVRSFVNSFNNLVRLVVVLIPWAIALFVIRLFWGIFKRRK